VIIDAIKIDRSFIDSMARDSRAFEIVRTVIMMAHNLNIKAIAEGVESEEQLEKLKTLKCDCCQGYLFSKPLTPQGVEAMLMK
jgi:EAL domain-containing protein (putative c-di-GMP-specific phosphodiesterase class I)